MNRVSIQEGTQSQSTQQLLAALKSRNSLLPRHVAIVMDGNGRWATNRLLPRIAGHRAGVNTVRAVVAAYVELGLEALTLFAFSSENWARPRQEVNFLMNLFYSVLTKEIEKLHQSNIRLRIIGDRDSLNPRLLTAIEQAELRTRDNTGLNLTLAVNYGGRWDITRATRNIAQLVKSNQLQPEEITEKHIHAHLSLAELPLPDLFIRTSGEYRISNFMIWQLAYSELIFLNTMWPDLTDELFLQAVSQYVNRERRFGATQPPSMACDPLVRQETVVRA